MLIKVHQISHDKLKACIITIAQKYQHGGAIAKCSNAGIIWNEEIYSNPNLDRLVNLRDC